MYPYKSNTPRKSWFCNSSNKFKRKGIPIVPGLSFLKPNPLVAPTPTNTADTLNLQRKRPPVDTLDTLHFQRKRLATEAAIAATANTCSDKSAQVAADQATHSKKQKEKCTYPTKGLSKTRYQALQSMKIQPTKGQRLIARSREYHDGQYREWKCYWTTEFGKELNGKELNPEVKIELRNKGVVAMYPKMVILSAGVQREMQEEVKYRQYHIQGNNREPRLHVLYSAQANASRVSSSDTKQQPGYVYHNIKMLALPLQTVPYIHGTVEKVGHLLGIANGEFKTGVDVIDYRSGCDGIFWHADDTQHEDVVACLVVLAEKGPRTLCIQPKEAPVDGDMQIELFPDSGDVYTMDGASQKSTVHAILKTKEDTGERLAIVMRSGKEIMVDKDSNHDVVTDLTPPIQTPPQYTFGNHLEEGVVYSRATLVELKGHQLDRRGVSGKGDVGCDAIIVTRVSKELQEHDAFETLSYHANPTQGAVSLFRSFQEGLPIRVFRTGGTESRSPYKPVSSVNASCKYRYDGIYSITVAFDESGEEVSNQSSNGRQKARRFSLKRILYKNGVAHEGLTVNRCSPTQILHPDYQWPC